MMQLFDSENISLAGKQKVPQMILRDFFAVLWIERTPMTKWAKVTKEISSLIEKLYTDEWPKNYS